MAERNFPLRIFSPLYSRMAVWSMHPHAPYYLAAISFIESSIFPIPPDVMMIPMSLARPTKALLYAHITLIASVLGGVFGYVIGMYLFKFIYPYFVAMGYEHSYELVKTWFSTWGFWAVIVAGCSPVPYKLFTIGAGALAMPLIPFIIASIIGRGLRFYLVCGLIYWGGERFSLFVTRYIDWMGWAFVFMIVILYGLWQGGLIHG